MKKKKPKRRLTNIQVSEISLVDRPAVPEATYVLVKRAMPEASQADILRVLAARNEWSDVVSKLDALREQLWHVELQAELAGQSLAKLGAKR